MSDLVCSACGKEMGVDFKLGSLIQCGAVGDRASVVTQAEYYKEAAEVKGVLYYCGVHQRTWSVYKDFVLGERCPDECLKHTKLSTIPCWPTPEVKTRMCYKSVR